MKFFQTLPAAVLLSMAFSGQALAHAGHIGELAGHSHWVGVGALVVAGALAAIVGKLAQKDEEKEEVADTETAEEAA